MRALAFCLCSAFFMCSAREFVDKLDRYIIACHSTDFECFKRQYKALRNNALLGNEDLVISYYEPYYFQYGDSGTCVKLSGLEESELVGIRMNSSSDQLTMLLELPLRVQQVTNNSLLCAQPELVFKAVEKPSGNVFKAVEKPSGNDTLKKFSGNATIQVIYPYEFRKKKGEIYMDLSEEALDVILDIPDITDYDKNNIDDVQTAMLSEWAYEVVQHINAAQDFVLPYTSKLRTLTERIPIHRLLLLYPEEDYNDLNFSYTETEYFQ